MGKLKGIVLLVMLIVAVMVAHDMAYQEAVRL